MNVLCGDLSIVGARSPTVYEVEEYDRWQNRRFDSAGLTNLWVISGKNKLTFDEMTRLDIRYSQISSLWADIKILVLTPLAMIKIALAKESV